MNKQKPAEGKAEIPAGAVGSCRDQINDWLNSATCEFIVLMRLSPALCGLCVCWLRVSPVFKIGVNYHKILEKSLQNAFINITVDV